MADTDSELFQSAIATVNTLGKRLQEALDALVGHNTDPEAHDDLREAIKRIMGSEAIYTKDQILALIRNEIDEHANTNFKDAHVGWKVWETQLDIRLTRYTDTVNELSTKVDKLINGGETSGPSTTLQEMINIINAKYNPRITELTNMIAKAKEDGDENLVSSYQQSLETTLAARNEEIIQATQAWVNGQTGSPDSGNQA